MPDDMITKKDIEDLNKGFEAFKETHRSQLEEIKKGAADFITADKLAKIEADLDAAQKKADEAALAVKRQSRIVTDAKGVEIDLDKKALDWARVTARRRGTDVTQFGASDLETYRKSFDAMLRKGEEIMGPDERKALSVGSDPDGGYVVHPDMNGRIVQKVYETSPMRAYASVQVISTDALEGDYDLDEASSGWVGETETRGTTDTPQLGKWRIPVHELYAKPKATQKLLDDAAINIESWLASKVSEKFARDESTAFVSGNGINRPRGFLTYTAGTTIPGQIEQHATAVNGAFAADPDGMNKLIDAIYSLKAPYRANSNWFATRGVMALARKLQDSEGNYQWQPSYQIGQPATLLGYPIASFEDLEALGTTSLSMAFGDMREAYQIVDRIGIRTLRDPYSAKPYVEFYTTKRVGGDVVNFEAIKIIRFGA